MTHLPVALAPHTTFGVVAHAAALRVAHTPTLLMDAVYEAKALGLPLKVLGEGSNVLFASNFKGMVVLNRIHGIKVLGGDAGRITLRVGAGTNWHALVRYAIHNDFGGLENLSLVPGTVGAAPIQNIGAYGVEASETIEAVHYVDADTGLAHSLSKADCHFGYRMSIFKSAAHAHRIITHVDFALTTGEHRLNLSYGGLQDELLGIARPTIEDVGAAVERQRRKKLPDWRVLGNAGSFFKNPVVTQHFADALKAGHGEMPTYKFGEGGEDGEGVQVKLSAGWLIEQAGMKGYREGRAGVSPNHALVLVNHGGATGQELLAVMRKVQAAVQDKFGVVLTPEVNVIGGV